jgi:hypothetical protein
MPEAFRVKHVVRHSSARYLVFRRKGQSRFRINVAPNQPCGCGAIHTGPRPRNPNAILVVLPVDPGSLLFGFCRASGVRDPLLQGTSEKIHFHNLLKTAAQPAQSAHTLLFLGLGGEFLNFSNQFLVLLDSRFREAPDSSGGTRCKSSGL